MAKPKYRFSHRSGGRYHWVLEATQASGFQEAVSCGTAWFWGWITDDDTLPNCNCKKRGHWGATGLMPDSNHCLVVKSGYKYLAHKVE